MMISKVSFNIKKKSNDSISVYRSKNKQWGQIAITTYHLTLGGSANLWKTIFKQHITYKLNYKRQHSKCP